MTGQLTFISQEVVLAATEVQAKRGDDAMMMFLRFVVRVLEPQLKDKESLVQDYVKEISREPAN